MFSRNGYLPSDPRFEALCPPFTDEIQLLAQRMPCRQKFLLCQITFTCGLAEIQPPSPLHIRILPEVIALKLQ